MKEGVYFLHRDCVEISFELKKKKKKKASMKEDLNPGSAAL